MTALISGTYTIVNPRTGGSRTVKITDDLSWMQNPPPVGTRMFSGMTGPDNENSFTGMGLVTPAGEIKVWAKAADRLDFIAATRWLLKNGAGQEVTLGQAYAFRSIRCFLCNLKLTTVASKFHGYGKACARNNDLPYDSKATLPPGHPLAPAVEAVAA